MDDDIVALRDVKQDCSRTEKVADVVATNMESEGDVAAVLEKNIESNDVEIVKIDFSAKVGRMKFGPGRSIDGARVAWPHLDTVRCDETGDGRYGPNGELIWTDGLYAVRRSPFSDDLLRDLMQASVTLPVPGLTRVKDRMACTALNGSLSRPSGCITPDSGCGATILTMRSGVLWDGATGEVVSFTGFDGTKRYGIGGGLLKIAIRDHEGHWRKWTTGPAFVVDDAPEDARKLGLEIVWSFRRL